MLLNEIKNRIAKVSKDDLAKRLSYGNSKRLNNALEKLHSYNSLQDWFLKPYFDLKYNQFTLIEAFCKEFNLDLETYNQELEDFKKLKTQIDRFENCHIRVITDFKRKNEPLLALTGLQKSLYIKLNDDKELYYKTLEEILETISNRIKNHYIGNNAKLEFWGNIQSYIFEFDKNRYNFDCNGNLIKN